jgi:peptidoglycan/LPS O-acetylase OafA/YrhL
LIVILTFALVAGWYILLENEYELLGKHIAAGSIYISNFVLQSESGYFDIDSELKPLLHLWSLAIEEQFYLAFPLLLILGARFRINPLLIISTGLGISFLLNVVQIDDKPTEVFFFPTSRAWELLIGSLIAYLSIHSIGKKQTEQFSNWLAWFGALLILTAWFFLNSKNILFPSWWALMPTMGAACLIFAGEKAWFNRKILASKIAVFIGLISYPLYLWHWVLLSFVRITEIEKSSTSQKIVILIISVILAWLTYQVIEKNLRFQKSKWVSLGLLICLLVVSFAGYLVKQENGFTGRYFLDKNWIDGEIGNDIFLKKGLTYDKNCVAKYTDQPFKTFSKNDFCLIQDPTSPPTALLVGDSHANHYYSWLVRNEELTGGNLLNRGSGGCFPFFDNPSTANEICPTLINSLLDMAITTPSISTVILAGRAVTDINKKSFIPQKTAISFFHSTEEENNPYLIFEKGMKKTLQRLTQAQKHIIFIFDIPELEFEPVACINRPWRLNGQMAKFPCAVPRTLVDSRHQKYREIVTQILSEFPDVKVLDPLSVLCDEMYCWAIKENKMLYRDNNHLNEVGAVYLSDHLF